MKTTIKNIRSLPDLSEKDFEMMEHAARQHKQFANINFRFIKCEGDVINIEISQEKNPAGHHPDRKRMIEIVHETFDRFFVGKTIHVGAIPYSEPACNIVDSKWIQKKMLDTSTRLNHIAIDTGMDKPNLSLIINGRKEITQPLKAFFYYYFECKKPL
ncbi:MAG: hypothetical protein KA954_01340 [Chitinophagales bacterium]|nr:hypothetical protein [Chitinophagales bacterium]MBP9845822.1 hypothetical protein [Saprospiraceae bacterium]